MSTLISWLLPGNFLPHGHCYLWRPDVLWLHVGSDALMATSYYAIPLAIAYIVRRRRAVLPYSWVAALFAVSLLLCGTTHLMSIWTVWRPDYIVDGLIKLAAALFAVTTTIVVFALPRVMALRTPVGLQREFDARTAELVAVNARLREEVVARQRTESALRESETRFRATFETAAVGIAMVAPDGHWLQVNEVLCRITGYSQEELLGRTFGDITYPADLATDWAQASALLAGDIDTYALEKRYVRKDGTICWVLLTVSLVRQADGSPHYFISVVDDITARKQVEEAVQQRQLRLQLALEASRAATWDVDFTHGSIEHFDARACEMGGLDPARADWPAGTLCGLLHPEDRSLLLKAAEQAHGMPGPGPTIEYRITPPGGQVLWLQGAGVVERDQEGRPRQFIGVSIDITERKRLESQLRLSIDKLADASNRKDQFLATLAHELRNPLAPIANGVQVIQHSPSAEVLKRTSEIMERQVRHLVRLVDDLLDVSRVTRGKATLRTESLQISEVLASALESSWTPREAERLELVMELPEQPISVTGDRDRLKQVFSNILSNAAKYTEGRGTVSVRGYREGSQAVISITDTGVGIPPEALEEIFEMFSQLQPPGHGEAGLGIGLALVHQLVQLHGGQVEARSQGIGHGSEFVVRLPALPSAPPAINPLPPSPRAPGAVAAPRRVLIVEDNADCAESLRTLLQTMGHEVREAGDGEDAIELTQTFRPEVIFMDIGLPRMNGLEATRRIRELPLISRPLIVALTGWGQDVDRQLSRQAGILHHLTKPISYETLQSVFQLTDLS
jgi:PAS domain S-box-containing protein